MHVASQWASNSCFFKVDFAVSSCRSEDCVVGEPHPEKPGDIKWIAFVNMMGKDMLYMFFYILPGSVSGAAVLLADCIIKPRVMGAAGIGLHCVAQDDMWLMQGRILEIQQLEHCYCWQINCEMSSNSRDKK